MTSASRRNLIRGGLFIAACACIAPRLALAADAPKGKWVCPPCGCAADEKAFDAPGACPECGMPLVPKALAPTPPKTLAADAHGGARAQSDRRGGNGWGTRTRT